MNNFQSDILITQCVCRTMHAVCFCGPHNVYHWRHRDKIWPVLMTQRRMSHYVPRKLTQSFRFRPRQVYVIFLLEIKCRHPSSLLYQFCSLIAEKGHCHLDDLVTHIISLCVKLKSIQLKGYIHYWTERIAHSIERLK